VFVVGLLIFFLVASSLEFPAEIFPVTCAREIMINEWNIPWVKPNKQMVHSLGYP
jgi:hypothetical protein